MDNPTKVHQKERQAAALTLAVAGKALYSTGLGKKKKRESKLLNK